MSIKAIILSGGSGKRFGSDIPKQYIEINGRPALSYTLQAFQKSCADEIIIVAGRDYLELCRETAVMSGISKFTAVIEGGSERYYSVMNGLRYLHETKDMLQVKAASDGQRSGTCRAADSRSDDIVLIHDGARPFVSVDVINEVAAKVRECGAAIAAVPCTDTIKITDDEGMNISTTDRSHTWAAQTPQGFWLDDIYAAYEHIIQGSCAAAADVPVLPAGAGTGANAPQSSSHLSRITDDAMVYQQFFPERKVKAVLSDSSNIKITRPQDLQLSSIILSRQ